MEFSFRIVIVAILALVVAVLIIMFMSTGTSGGSEAFRNVTDWIGGMTGT